MRTQWYYLDLTLLASIALLLLFTFWSCERDNVIPCTETFTDSRDGNVYNIVQIGDQCWFKENLKYLPEVYPPDYGSSTAAIYYVWGYKGSEVSEAIATDNYENYGVLYNWTAALDACPPGWRLPGYEEWTKLERALCTALGNADCDSIFPLNKTRPGFRGTNEGNALKSCLQSNSPLSTDCASHHHPKWSFDSTQFGTDQFRFSALPGGIRSSDLNGFYNLGHWGHWWTSAEYSTLTAWYRQIYSYRSNVGSSYYNKMNGASVRCIRN